IELTAGDVVAVEGSPGHDIGTVSLAGELVRLQLKAYEITEDSNQIKALYRIAKPADIEKWESVKQMEFETMHKARSIALRLNLKMKLSDVEYQGDGKKATFYYTADERVDFRELIKKLADEFKVRIEMRQIGMRQEASRLGGIGSCGRELCCSTWLTDFKIVSTSAARYQNLSLNPIKLAGQCGKLKCCLNYELDGYMEAIKDIPDASTKLQTMKGPASHRKTDILKRIMWFGYDEVEAGMGSDHWVALPVDRVKEVIEMNKSAQKPPDLMSLAEFDEVEEKPVDYADVVGQDSLTRMMDKRKKKKKKKKREGDGSTQQPRNERREAVQTPRPDQGGNRQGRVGPSNQGSSGQQPSNRNNQQRRERPQPSKPGGERRAPEQSKPQGPNVGPPRKTPAPDNTTPPTPPTPSQNSTSQPSAGGRVRQIPPRTNPNAES
ncbi:MAG: regulatory iron-sulfur-containing complex subunit RicT, partial [Bacteroidota bacterium]